MTNIVIHSEELLRFGGIEYCMSQKKLSLIAGLPGYTFGKASSSGINDF